MFYDVYTSNEIKYGVPDWSEYSEEDSTDSSENSLFVGINSSDITKYIADTKLCRECDRYRDFIRYCPIFCNPREKELLYKMLKKTENQTQTENSEKEIKWWYIILRALIVIFMWVLSLLIINDCGVKTKRFLDYCSKCCVCNFFSSTINYLSSIVRR